MELYGTLKEGQMITLENSEKGVVYNGVNRAYDVYPLFAFLLLEIVTVTARRNPREWNQGCGTLEKKLNAYGDIQKIELTSGKVVMYWKPNAPFNYQALKRNFQAVGVGLLT